MDQWVKWQFWHSSLQVSNRVSVRKWHCPAFKASQQAPQEGSNPSLTPNLMKVKNNLDKPITMVKIKLLILFLLLSASQGCKDDEPCIYPSEVSCESRCSGSWTIFDFKTNVDSLKVRVLNSKTGEMIFVGYWYRGGCITFPYSDGDLLILDYIYVIDGEEKALSRFGLNTLDLIPCKRQFLEFEYTPDD